VALQSDLDVGVALTTFSSMSGPILAICVPSTLPSASMGTLPRNSIPATIAAWSRSASAVISKWMLAVSARGWMCPVVDRQDRKQILLVTARSGIGIPDAGQQLRFFPREEQPRLARQQHPTHTVRERGGRAASKPGLPPSRKGGRHPKFKHLNPNLASGPKHLAHTARMAGAPFPIGDRGNATRAPA
jgi:hypothetical protein